MDKKYIIDNLERTGRTQLALAKYMGLEASIVNKIVKGRRRIQSEEADKIRIFFSDSLTQTPFKGHNVQLLGDVPHTIPLIGNVQAGAFIEAVETESVEEIPVIGELAKYKNAFGLRVLGDSMDKIYPEGTLLICQQLSDHFADLKPGNKVVVKRRAAGDLFEITVKEYSEDGNAKILTPLSHNPKYKPLRITNGDIDHHAAGASDIEIWSIVIASQRIEV